MIDCKDCLNSDTPCCPFRKEIETYSPYYMDIYCYAWKYDINSLEIDH